MTRKERGPKPVEAICVVIILSLVSLAAGRQCYICSGSMPQRECVFSPATVRHGPIKQECGNRYCTTYIRYRPMQHLLIPLGPNKPKATAAPLRPNDFEAMSISRDCVDRVDPNRDNRCFPDGTGLGATCFSSCREELCNGGLRKPNFTELGHHGRTLPPLGPNEYEPWTPTRRSSARPTTARPTTPPRRPDDGDDENEISPPRGRPGNGRGKVGGKERHRPVAGRGGDRANIRGFGEEVNGATTQRAEVLTVVMVTVLAALRQP